LISFEKYRTLRRNRNAVTLVRNIPGTGPTPISVRVLASPAIEAVVAFWTQAVEVEEVESYAEVEALRAIWAKTEDISDDVAWMARNYASTWCALIPVIDELEADDLATVADHLHGLSAEAVAGLIGVAWHDHEHCDADCEKGEHELGEPAEVKTRVVRSLRAVHERVGEDIAGYEPKLKHTSELIRFLKRRMGLDQLVETVTNGVAYEAEAGVREVVLTPSALLRPWNLLFLFGDSRYIVHPISEDSVDAEDDTPPSWMIDMFKALGDERRLKIMRHLRETDGATLGELSEYLGLAKSTTHHHLRTLRAAGLIRARLMQGEKKEESLYELRENLLPDVVGLVGEYLLADSTQSS
jgi:DNA-binding transcriptional ArsR family regulator